MWTKLLYGITSIFVVISVLIFATVAYEFESDRSILGELVFTFQDLRSSLALLTSIFVGITYFSVVYKRRKQYRTVVLILLITSSLYNPIMDRLERTVLWPYCSNDYRYAPECFRYTLATRVISFLRYFWILNYLSTAILLTSIVLLTLSYLNLDEWEKRIMNKVKNFKSNFSG
ncbi:hypothetical protein J7K41_03950 [Candidatus Micrarchaeota archaeon]|nr:hypothetical protein [Candidatus Micrarchaeota archaeon]